MIRVFIADVPAEERFTLGVLMRDLQLEARQQAAVSSGADAFISKTETGDRLADRFLQVAEAIRSNTAPD